MALTLFFSVDSFVSSLPSYSVPRSFHFHIIICIMQYQTTIRQQTYSYEEQVHYIGESIDWRRWKNDNEKRREKVEKEDEIRNYSTFFYTLLFCKGFYENRLNLEKCKTGNWSYAGYQQLLDMHSCWRFCVIFSKSWTA